LKLIVPTKNKEEKVEKNKMLKSGLVVGLLITLVSIGGCAPAGESEGGFDLSVIIFLAVIFGLMYLVLIRPQRKKQKEHQQLVAELKRGDKVITAGGIYGQIESVSEDTVVLKVESGATIRVTKGGILNRPER
jgi:preprotein translocase subunit YajC